MEAQLPFYEQALWTALWVFAALIYGLCLNGVIRKIIGRIQGRIGPPFWQPIIDLARHDNLYVKISDVKGRSREDFPFADMHDYVRMLVDAFGAERCLWGTGYPGQHRTKHNWLSLAEELRLVREGFDFLSASQRERILGGTAAEVWGLA
mgnify:CR=1 FL=1